LIYYIPCSVLLHC